MNRDPRRLQGLSGLRGICTRSHDPWVSCNRLILYPAQKRRNLLLVLYVNICKCMAKQAETRKRTTSWIYSAVRNICANCIHHILKIPRNVEQKQHANSFLYFSINYLNRKFMIPYDINTMKWPVLQCCNCVNNLLRL